MITDFGELGFGFWGLRIQTFGVTITDFGELGILGFNQLLWPKVLALDCPKALAHNLIKSSRPLAFQGLKSQS